MDTSEILKKLGICLNNDFCAVCELYAECGGISGGGGLLKDTIRYIGIQDAENTQLKYELDQLSKQQPKWIHVDDALPEDDDPKLVVFHDVAHHCDFVGFTNYICGKNRWSMQRIKNNLVLKVTHWMPLPELPYKPVSFLDVFLQKFPGNEVKGTPIMTACHLFPQLKDSHCVGHVCNECWDSPYFEGKKEGDL